MVGSHCNVEDNSGLRLAGLKDKLPLLSAAPQAARPEAPAEKTLIMKVPFT